jgi:hypothetical protein
MATLTLNAQIIAQLKYIAAERGIGVEELAEEALTQFLRDEARRTLQLEAGAFRAMHADLLDKYPNEYVAIHQGRVVDHDTNQLALFKRLDEQYPGIPILVTQVTPESKSTTLVDIEGVDLDLQPPNW